MLRLTQSTQPNHGGSNSATGYFSGSTTGMTSTRNSKNPGHVGGGGSATATML